MKTIVAFSDTHGYPIPQKILDVASESDFVFFLGDGVRGLGDLLLHKGFVGVCGNCDAPYFEKEKTLEIEGVKVFLTHGDLYRVKSSLLPLSLRAKELGCAAVLYGHTHTASICEDDFMTLICCGSPTLPAYSPPSYAYAVINNGKLIAKIVNLNEFC